MIRKRLRAKPLRVDSSAVVPLEAVFTHTKNGKDVKYSGAPVFVVVREADGWKIAAYAWHGK